VPAEGIVAVIIVVAVPLVVAVIVKDDADAWADPDTGGEFGVGPVGPCRPVAPVKPVEPVNPVAPVDPVAPVGPVTPPPLVIADPFNSRIPLLTFSVCVDLFTISTKLSVERLIDPVLKFKNVEVMTIPPIEVEKDDKLAPLIPPAPTDVE
jgi:hypothetical protein